MTLIKSDVGGVIVRRPAGRANSLGNAVLVRPRFGFSLLLAKHLECRSSFIVRINAPSDKFTSVSCPRIGAPGPHSAPCPGDRSTIHRDQVSTRDSRADSINHGDCKVYAIVGFTEEGDRKRNSRAMRVPTRSVKANTRSKQKTMQPLGPSKGPLSPSDLALSMLRKLGLQRQ
jgi:hypothetical protein